MSTDRVYRKRLMPHEVIEYIRDTGRNLFDPEFTEVFLKHIAPFPIGCEVLLNNGERGVVVKTFKDLPARPLVKVIFDPLNNLLSEPFDIDLKQDLTVFIVKALRDRGLNVHNAFRVRKSCRGMKIKSKRTAYLLWLLSIFGWLGLHRFYLGRNG